MNWGRKCTRFHMSGREELKDMKYVRGKCTSQHLFLTQQLTQQLVPAAGNGEGVYLVVFG